MQINNIQSSSGLNGFNQHSLLPPKQCDFQIMMLHIYLPNSSIPKQFGAYAASWYLCTNFTYISI